MIFHYKSRDYVNRSRRLHDLKANTREEIDILPDTLVRFMANTSNQFIQYIDNGERHLPDMIFKTVKQNFKHVLSLGNKNKTFMIL